MSVAHLPHRRAAHAQTAPLRPVTAEASRAGGPAAPGGERGSAIAHDGAGGAPADKAAALTDREKAMLFDLALASAARPNEAAQAIAAAPLILAFARAYVAIRDREEGIV
ncbi:MAG: hypothetical protein NW200_00790 [Hyphomonadaceae bacterium]|nr:hypothetical protein [Hyphomonadaceae bacterium]